MSSRTSTIRQLLRASAALGATLLIGAATAAYAAAPALEAPSVRVSYHDLNLATEQGTLALYGRIVAAAQKVCRVSDIRDLQQVTGREGVSGAGDRARGTGRGQRAAGGRLHGAARPRLEHPGKSSITRAATTEGG